MRLRPFLAPAAPAQRLRAILLAACSCWVLLGDTGCGPDIKGEPLAQTDTGEPPGTDTAHETTDTSDPEDTGPPPTGDVEVRFELSWEMGTEVREVCAGELTLTDVDTSHRTWALWTDAGLELDPTELPSEAPAQTPVGDGTTVNPGAYRFSFDASTDPDLPAYDAAVAGGARPTCLLSSGADFDLQLAPVADPLPERVGPIDAVELRLTVLWTER